MTHQVRHTAAGEGIELSAPDAVITVKIAGGDTEDSYELFEVDAPRGPTAPPHREEWAKAFYVLSGRMIVQVEDRAIDLGPGTSIAIPPGSLNTFTVLSPTTKFLTFSLTGAMGRFLWDLSATVPHGRPVEEVAQQIQGVLARHEVALGNSPEFDLESLT